MQLSRTLMRESLNFEAQNHFMMIKRKMQICQYQNINYRSKMKQNCINLKLRSSSISTKPFFLLFLNLTYHWKSEMTLTPRKHLQVYKLKQSDLREYLNLPFYVSCFVKWEIFLLFVFFTYFGRRRKIIKLRIIDNTYEAQK